MSLTRVAFIIGSNESVHATLAGVDADHDNYRAFLTSSAGGGWDDSEIFDLEKPSRRALNEQLQGQESDYALVVFSGHGFSNEDGETYVCLNDKVDVPTWELSTGALRQTTIIDACRTVLREDVVKAEKKKFGSWEPEANRYFQSCRALYDSAVREAEEGIETLFAASPAQAAADSRDGGRFSRALVGEARSWATGIRAPGGDAMFVLRVDMALEKARKAMTVRRLPQRPVGDYGRRHYHFPFAVA